MKFIIFCISYDMNKEDLIRIKMEDNSCSNELYIKRYEHLNFGHFSILIHFSQFLWIFILIFGFISRLKMIEVGFYFSH